LEVEGAERDPPLRPTDVLGERKDDEQEEHDEPVQDTLVAAEYVWVQRGEEGQDEDSEGDVGLLPEEVVA
jgi:hypothetical protein